MIISSDNDKMKEKGEDKIITNERQNKKQPFASLRDNFCLRIIRIR